jgi:hypothetical protein
MEQTYFLCYLKAVEILCMAPTINVLSVYNLPAAYYGIKDVFFCYLGYFEWHQQLMFYRYNFIYALTPLQNDMWIGDYFTLPVF